MRFTMNDFNLNSNLKFQMGYFSPLERRRAGYCEVVDDSLKRVSCAGRVFCRVNVGQLLTVTWTELSSKARKFP